jgi:hypothetical protein
MTEIANFPLENACFIPFRNIFVYLQRHLTPKALYSLFIVVRRHVERPGERGKQSCCPRFSFIILKKGVNNIVAIS